MAFAWLAHAHSTSAPAASLCIALPLHHALLQPCARQRSRCYWSRRPSHFRLHVPEVKRATLLQLLRAFDAVE
jgi:hypothetical protein